MIGSLLWRWSDGYRGNGGSKVTTGGLDGGSEERHGQVSIFNFCVLVWFGLGLQIALGA